VLYLLPYHVARLTPINVDDAKRVVNISTAEDGRMNQ